LTSIKEQAKKIALDRYLAEAGFSAEFIENLKKGYLFIPQDQLRSQIERAIGMQDGVTLKDCSFSPEGIQLELQVHRFHARLALPLKLQLTAIAINSQEQVVAFNFVNGRSKGENWVGKVAAAVADRFIAGKLNDQIVKSGRMIESQADHRCGRCVLDLGSIEQLQPFKKKIPILGLMVLDVLSIHVVEHVANGIRLKGELFRSFKTPPTA
jgi:hypothetical protein